MDLRYVKQGSFLLNTHKNKNSKDDNLFYLNNKMYLIKSSIDYDLSMYINNKNSLQFVYLDNLNKKINQI